MSAPGPDAAERAAFRAFVREHHPDRGGDPEAFVAGVARYRADAVASRPAPEPPADPADPAPVDLAALPLPVRVGVALLRTWKRSRADRPR